MSDNQSNTHHEPATNDCSPTECPQCGAIILGATAEDWGEHFAEDCNPLGQLYCFAEPVTEDETA